MRQRARGVQEEPRGATSLQGPLHSPSIVSDFACGFTCSLIFACTPNSVLMVSCSLMCKLRVAQTLRHPVHVLPSEVQ